MRSNSYYLGPTSIVSLNPGQGWYFFCGRTCQITKSLFSLEFYGAFIITCPDYQRCNFNHERVYRTWEYLYDSKILPAHLRMDKGTETGTIATMQSYLHKEHTDLDDPIDESCIIAS